MWKIGMPLTEEHKEKLRKLMKKKNPMFREEILDKVSKTRKGKKAWNKGKIEWRKCKECGKQVRKWRVFCSNECFWKNNTGENNNKWKGGITPIYEKIRHSPEYKLWRESVYKRDNYSCIWCGRLGGWNKELKKRIILNADHIKPFALFPELRFAIDNGRTLCKDCHKTTETYGNRPIYK